MSTYMELSGELHFNNNESKLEALRILENKGYGRIGEFNEEGTKSFVHINSANEELAEDYEIIGLEGTCLPLTAGIQNNIHIAFDAIYSDESIKIDHEKTHYRAACYDGNFSLGEQRGKDHYFLTDKEMSEIIGHDIKLIDWGNDDTKEFHYIRAIEKADDWLCKG